MDKQMIYFSKLKENAIIPSKRDEDGAFDIYACFEEEYLVLEPHTTVMVPTGIASAFSSDYVAILKERGSTGTKGIGQRSGVIDSGYRGEWLMPITNHNEVPLIIMKKESVLPQSLSEDLRKAIIYPYEKALSQCIMVEVPKLQINEIPYEELVQFQSQRGTGRLGSSGK
ncbi:dUTP pyrophosphatase [Sporanaerobium hydrogeniformans]|uniref:dUTP pyrophosphatase n=1 Tax=Sporanaerobium hydrogeniformans TaxID=3072179 RepID=A0AC61DHE6_9FIRM|nr:dUTP pyrophosphatase [Sporanaerobium hydrogeniformans]PHV72071.1 dUTP pyrophosphatase [Sporanaerobium hydrogeniformans]